MKPPLKCWICNYNDLPGWVKSQCLSENGGGKEMANYLCHYLAMGGQEHSKNVEGVIDFYG